MKKIFGGLNLTWPKVIIMAIIIGVYTAISLMLPITKDTSFSDLGVTFEVWILFGILIITNSKSKKDSALKCFAFFLISQPLIYLIQDLVNHTSLFNTYYKTWFIVTLFCIVMGYIGYLIKKDKLYSVIILMPMLLLLFYSCQTYLSYTIFSFPRHLLSFIFSATTMIMYPLVLFDKKINKCIGLFTSIVLLLAAITMVVLNPPVYSTDILSSKEEYVFDDTYTIEIKDKNYGDLSIRYENNIEDFMVHAEFKKAGITEFTITSPSNEKKTFKVTILKDKYDVEEIKD